MLMLWTETLRLQDKPAVLLARSGMLLATDATNYLHRYGRTLLDNR